MNKKETKQKQETRNEGAEALNTIDGVTYTHTINICVFHISEKTDVVL